MLGKAVESLSPRLTGRTSEESWFEFRQRFIPSQKRPSSLWDLPSLLFNGYRVLFPWPHSDKDMKHTAHLHLLPDQISRTMPQLRLHIFIHDVNRDILSPDLSKQNEGRVRNKAASSGWQHTKWKRKLRTVRKSLRVAVSRHARKNKTLERFVQGTWLARAKRVNIPSTEKSSLVVKSDVSYLDIQQWRYRFLWTPCTCPREFDSVSQNAKAACWFSFNTFPVSLKRVNQ
jgi:hypothetical protein